MDILEYKVGFHNLWPFICKNNFQGKYILHITDDVNSILIFSNIFLYWMSFAVYNDVWVKICVKVMLHIYSGNMLF